MTIREFLQQHDGHRMTLEIQTGKPYGKLTSTTAKVTNLDLLAASVSRSATRVTGSIQKAYCCGQHAEALA